MCSFSLHEQVKYDRYNSRLPRLGGPQEPLDWLSVKVFFFYYYLLNLSAWSCLLLILRWFRRPLWTISSGSAFILPSPKTSAMERTRHSHTHTLSLSLLHFTKCSFFFLEKISRIREMHRLF